MSAKDHLPYDVLDLDGLRDDFAAGRVRQVGVVARRLLATLDAVLSSQGMVRASRPRASGDAPEACPVAIGSASFGVVDCDGNLYADSHRDAERRVSILNGSDIAGKPYRVIPLYAQPASATAEGVVSKTYAGFLRPMLDDIATPASAAGREGAVEAFLLDVEHFAKWVNQPNAPVAYYVRERATELAKHARALLAAEAEERGEGVT